jgi:hypothetical protein
MNPSVMGGIPDRHSAGNVRLLRRLVRFAASVVSKVCLTVVRAIVGSVVFIICAMAMMRYFGLPVPVPDELFDKFESLGRLAGILS